MSIYVKINRKTGHSSEKQVIRQEIVTNQTIYVITFVGYLCHFIIINNLLIL